MTISSSSSVGDIYIETPIAATTADLAAWTELDLPTNTASVQTTSFNTGLFGYDLTKFFTYCATVDDCNSKDYNAYHFDGWAIGANITLSDYSDPD
jgi:hypothetical protein